MEVEVGGVFRRFVEEDEEEDGGGWRKKRKINIKL